MTRPHDPHPLGFSIAGIPRDVPIVVDAETFAFLYEYSCSLPTGTTIGKQWRVNLDAYAGEAGRARQFVGAERWKIAEYGPHPDTDWVRIHWRRLLTPWQAAVYRDLQTGGITGVWIEDGGLCGTVDEESAQGVWAAASVLALALPGLLVWVKRGARAA